MSVKGKVDKYMNELKIPEALEEIFEIFKRCNKYIDETTPWILAKEDNKDRLKKVIYNLLESIRIGAVLLSPYLPDTSNEIFRQLNTKETSFDSIDEFGKLKVGDELNDPKPLFLRVDKEKM